MIKTTSLEINVKPAVKEIRYLGDKQVLSTPQVAIVGSRSAGKEELKYTTQLAEQLVEAGYAIISGIAQGVDAAAHRGALNAGGKTTAVLGCGIKQFFPSENKSLGRELIKSGGLIISEQEDNTPVAAWQLINRNRLIVALSVAVIIVNTGVSGGTMYSARDSFRYQKPLFVSSEYGGEGGKLLLASPAKELPELIKQFKLSKAEQAELPETPLAQKINLNQLSAQLNDL